MSELRVSTVRVRAGSAARQAEQVSAEAGRPTLHRVPAGSAARLAEEAKRAGEGSPAGGASFSLRAQGGQVQRMPVPVTQRVAAETAEISTAAVIRNADQGAPAEPGTPRLRNEQVSTQGQVAETALPEVADGTSNLRAEPSHVTGRLETFLRGLFVPEKSSQP